MILFTTLHTMPDGMHWMEVAMLCTARKTKNTHPTKNDVSQRFATIAGKTRPFRNKTPNLVMDVSPKIPRTLTTKAIPVDDAHVDRSQFENYVHMAAMADAMVAAMVTAMRQ